MQTIRLNHFIATVSDWPTGRNMLTQTTDYNRTVANRANLTTTTTLSYAEHMSYDTIL